MRALWMLGVLALGAGVPTGCAALPESNGAFWPSLVGPSGVEGWRSKHVLFFIVPVEQGVVLIDTGYDDEGDDLRQALQGRTVRAVFITHGHVDHYAGAVTLGRVPTFAGAADHPQILGDEVSGGLLPGLGDRLLPHPRPPQMLRAIADGEVVRADDVGAPGRWQVEAIALPGHTPGSTAYRIGDLLFVGDAVGAPPGFSDDEAGVQRSLRKLLDRQATSPARFMFDGHGGREEDPRTKLDSLLVNSPSAPGA